MDKIILNNNISLEFNSIYNSGEVGLIINFTNKSITELETLMTKDNLTKLQVANSTGEVYGIYNNLECTSITKKLTDNSVTINLTKLDDTQIKIAELQQTVDALVATTLEV
ncbi:hypothetical protein CBE01nite_35700 [Clostridium beijerinckii]|uniref:Uncharacterized protein n=1 Tax=Clostridium beijerinckii TaxID=1520 RepID=A0AB74VHQ4_CLOBE|nr:hypothetical protein [Clostridium beijerinckii]NRZ25180.1 hypothetical protein [Clostridium beijerinckii]NYB99894.1 hypothetical protein [Clostridium beijerinckii]OOM26455.1 hypothetical protein CLBEI_10490 [Clostridium beijerinckii]QUN35966.1 hypothetical protein KEC93_03810 [Clostridium beijerinckii]SQB13349.1 Uncharacterised protein [Clostridium beijerinckii]